MKTKLAKSRLSFMGSEGGCPIYKVTGCRPGSSPEVVTLCRGTYYAMPYDDDEIAANPKGLLGCAVENVRAYERDGNAVRLGTVIDEVY